MCENDKQRDFEEWLSARPKIIQQLGNRLPPWNRYRMKETGQHCSMYSYSEDGTVTVTVDGHDSEPLDTINKMCPVNVFGVHPDDLEILA